MKTVRNRPVSVRQGPDEPYPMRYRWYAAGNRHPELKTALAKLTSFYRPAEFPHPAAPGQAEEVLPGLPGAEC